MSTNKKKARRPQQWADRRRLEFAHRFTVSLKIRLACFAEQATVFDPTVAMACVR
jgi:hypothetical protein